MFTSTSGIFPLGCLPVTDAAALWTLVNRTIATALAQNPVASSLSGVNVAAAAVCPPSDTSTECDDARATLEAINAVPPGAQANFKDFTLAIQQLLMDAGAFACVQGWGPCPE